MRHVLKLAAAGIGALVLLATPTLANDAGTASKSSGATHTYESGFEPTQRRIRGRRPARIYVAPRRRSNVGRNVAIGVGAAVIGGIIASEAAPANSRSYSSGRGNCNRWEWQCNNGQGWACRNLDRYC
jgi:hypothetical protein